MSAPECAIGTNIPIFVQAEEVEAALAGPPSAWSQRDPSSAQRKGDRVGSDTEMSGQCQQ